MQELKLVYFGTVLLTLESTLSQVLIIKWPWNISFFLPFLSLQVFFFWVHSETTTTKILIETTRSCQIYWFEVGWKKWSDEMKEVDAEVHRRSVLGGCTDQVNAGSSKMHHHSLTRLVLVLKETWATSCHHLCLDDRSDLLQRICLHKYIWGVIYITIIK